MKNKMAQITFLIMVGTVLSRIVGFFREIIIGSVLGTSYIADAYLVSLSLPTIIFANITSAIGTTFIPIYIKKKENKSTKEYLIFTNNLINIVSLISIVISIICIIFVKQITGFFAGGFDENTLKLAAKISKIMFTTMIFIGINSILTSYLNANNKFFLTSILQIPHSLIIICSLILYNKIGIMGVACANLGGMFLQTVILFIQAMHIGFRFKIVLNIKDSAIKEILSLAIPVFIGTGIGQINVLIDKMLASGLPHGSISALNFANKLENFIFGITASAISVAIYPLLSTLNAKNKKDSYVNIFSKSFNAITILLTPITVASCILNSFVVRMLFERGAFDSRSTILTASALFYYSLGMLFMGYNMILSKSFYSLQDTKTPLKNSMLSIVVNICLNLILVKTMAHNGLALATSISAVLANFLLTRSLRKKIGKIGGRKILKTALKAGSASAFMGIVIKILQLYFDAHFRVSNTWNQVLIFLFISLIGFLVYILCLVIFRTEELDWLVSLIKASRNTKHT